MQPIDTSSSQIQPQLPVELQGAYDALYKKISGMIAGHTIDLKSDPTTLRVIIEAAMAIVEQCRDSNGNTWSGPEKKRYALTLIKYIFRDLAANGVLDPAVASELSANIDFFGGVVMDVAIDAIKGMFNIGQTFIQDARATGCKAACAKDCCNIV